MNAIVDSVLDVFGAVGTWIAETVPTFIPMFYSAESGLTWLGVMAVMGLAFSVVFLMIGLIQKFLHFAG